MFPIRQTIKRIKIKQRQRPKIRSFSWSHSNGLENDYHFNNEIARWHVHKICNHCEEMEWIWLLVLVPYGPSFYVAFLILHEWYNSHCTEI